MGGGGRVSSSNKGLMCCGDGKGKASYRWGDIERMMRLSRRALEGEVC